MVINKETLTSKNEDLLLIVKGLVETFKFEKWLYNISTMISFVLLLICACFLLFDNTCKNYVEAAGMFGSTGVITFTGSRMLKMWDDAMKFVNQHYSK